MAESETRSPAAPHTLSRDDVLRLAHLARLELTDDETEDFTEQLSAVLGYIEQLENVPPPPSAEAPPAEVDLERNTTSDVVPRADTSPSMAVSQLSLSPEAALDNAPQTAQGLIAVPSVTASAPDQTA